MAGLTRAQISLRRSMTDEQWFWNCVDKSEGCWNWSLSLQDTGYGQHRWRGTTCLCHRVSYEITVGSIPKGAFICHRCDNKKCVRPDHLFIGTCADNNADMWRKGRGKSGWLSRRSQVAFETRFRIHKAYLLGETQRNIAAWSKVSQSHVSRILRGKAPQ